MYCSSFSGYGICTGELHKELTLKTLYNFLDQYSEVSDYAFDLKELVKNAHKSEKEILDMLLERKSSYNGWGIFGLLQEVIYETKGVLLDVFHHAYGFDKEEAYLYVSENYPWNIPKSKWVSKSQYDEIFSEFTAALGEEVAPKEIYFVF